MRDFLLRLAATMIFAMPVFAADPPGGDLEVTGIVVGDKIKNSAIINDQIVWEGNFYKEDGFNTELKVVKIEKGIVTFEWEGEQFTKRLKSRAK